MTLAHEALGRLREGNQRFAANVRGADPYVSHMRRANIRASVDHLRHGSQVLEELIQRDGLLVVGAEYSLETGLVDFFDGASAKG